MRNQPNPGWLRKLHQPYAITCSTLTTQKYIKNRGDGYLYKTSQMYIYAVCVIVLKSLNQRKINIMSRLVIDMSSEQHQQIKALAAMQGKSIKRFVLEQIFPAEKTDKEQKAWDKLQALLASRIRDAETGAVANKTFDQITDEVIKG